MEIVIAGQQQFLEELDQPMGGALGEPGTALYRTKMAQLLHKKQFRFSPDAGATTYLVDRYIADGTFGQCYFAKNEATNEVKVLKLFKESQAVAHTTSSGWTSELANLVMLPSTCLEHRNIMSVRSVSAESLISAESTQRDFGFLLNDACTNGEIFDFIISAENGPFSEQMARYFVRDLLLAVQHLHSHGVAHRDLKCENILIDSAGRLRVCDFGFTKFFESSVVKPKSFGESYRERCAAIKHRPFTTLTAGHTTTPPTAPTAPTYVALNLQKTETTQVSTKAYDSPELVLKRGDQRRADREFLYHHGPRIRVSYNADKLDLFACGVVAFVLQVGQMPFGDVDSGVSHSFLSRAHDAGDASNTEFWEEWRRKLHSWHHNYSLPYPARLSVESESFLNRIFKFDASAIPTVDELLLDPWLAIDDDDGDGDGPEVCLPMNRWTGQRRYPCGDEMAADLMKRKAGVMVNVDAADWAAAAYGTPADSTTRTAALGTSSATASETSSADGSMGERATAAPPASGSGGGSSASASAAPMIPSGAQMIRQYTMAAISTGETGIAESAFRQSYVYDFVGAALEGDDVDRVAVLIAALRSAVAAGPVRCGVLLNVVSTADSVDEGSAASGTRSPDAAPSEVVHVVSKDERGIVDVHLIVVAKARDSATSFATTILEIERHIGEALEVSSMLSEIVERIDASDAELHTAN